MKTKNIISVFLFLAILTLSTNSCSKGDSYGSSGGGGPTATNVVSIQAMQFQPASITVIEGSTVTWKNMDTEIHTVTSDDGTSFNSGNIAPQGSYTFTASIAGAYAYHCSLHPSMKGTLLVAVMSGQ